MRRNFFEHIIDVHESRHYRAEADLIETPPLPGPNIRVLAEDPAEGVRLLAHFDRLTHERVGGPPGEYLLMPDLHVLVGRNGVCLRANTCPGNIPSTKAVEEQYRALDLPATLPWALERWDSWPAIPTPSPSLLSDIYCQNYYHFSLEMVPRLRFLLADPGSLLLVRREAQHFAFQRDLLARVIGERAFAVPSAPVRVRDPRCAFGHLSAAGLHFLRDATGLRAVAGRRRLYLRRPAHFTRAEPGGGISEDADFTAMVQDFGFETVTFGGGERSVAEQVAMLDGAGIILAPHGSAMTNLAYLTPPVAIIEIMGPRAARACFVHVSAILGLAHTVIMTEAYDEAGHMRVNADLLRDTLRQAGCRSTGALAAA